MESQPPNETEQVAEHPLLEDLLDQSHRLVKRIITLCRNKNQDSLNPEIIFKGKITDQKRENKAVYITDCGNGFGIVIKRDADLKNLITEVTVIFYPHNWDKVNYLRDIETGLAEEYAKKHNQPQNESIKKMETELKNRGPKGVSLSRITVSFTRGRHSSDDPQPILVRLSLNLADNTTIEFDPLKNYREIREESGPYARTVYKRVLDRLDKAVREEELHSVSVLLKKAFSRPLALSQIQGESDSEKKE
jgi:hypothetical protein